MIQTGVWPQILLLKIPISAHLANGYGVCTTSSLQQVSLIKLPNYRESLAQKTTTSLRRKDYTKTSCIMLDNLKFSTLFDPQKRGPSVTLPYLRPVLREEIKSMTPQWAYPSTKHIIPPSDISSEKSSSPRPAFFY